MLPINNNMQSTLLTRCIQLICLISIIPTHHTPPQPTTTNYHFVNSRAANGTFSRIQMIQCHKHDIFRAMKSTRARAIENMRAIENKRDFLSVLCKSLYLTGVYYKCNNNVILTT